MDLPPPPPCENCISANSYVECLDCGISLCSNCDTTIHNSLAQHRRLPLEAPVTPQLPNDIIFDASNSNPDLLPPPIINNVEDSHSLILPPPPQEDDTQHNSPPQPLRPTSNFKNQLTTKNATTSNLPAPHVSTSGPLPTRALKPNIAPARNPINPKPARTLKPAASVSQISHVVAQQMTAQNANQPVSSAASFRSRPTSFRATPVFLKPKTTDSLKNEQRPSVSRLKVGGLALKLKGMDLKNINQPNLKATTRGRSSTVDSKPSSLDVIPSPEILQFVESIGDFQKRFAVVNLPAQDTQKVREELKEILFAPNLQKPSEFTNSLNALSKDSLVDLFTTMCYTIDTN